MIGRTLWLLEPPDPGAAVSNPSDLPAALRLHLRHTPGGLTTVLLQIGTTQRAYLLHGHCPGCRHDHCRPGCRWALLKRVLAIHLPAYGVRAIPHGVRTDRPYTRAVVAWPTRDAQPLDGRLLQPWREARLMIAWHRGPRTTVRAAAVLLAGDDGPDPGTALRTRGWRVVVLPCGQPVMGGQPQSLPPWLCQRWRGDPMLLLPQPAPPPEQPLAAVPRLADWDDAASMSVAYGRAATITAYVEAAGGRVEQLDLHGDGRTATVVVTGQDGGNPAPIWHALAGADGPLELGDVARGRLALRPDAAVPAPPLPLLLLGAPSGGPQRWRPVGSTAHLALVGPVVGDIMYGMLGPLLGARPDLRVGVLDVTAGGALALPLATLPGRLPTHAGTNVMELLGAVGGLPAEQPVVVVVHAATAAAVEALIVPLLRAAQYRPLGLIVAVPDLADLPSVLHDRLPVLQITAGHGHWARRPSGWWRWADTCWLRLPRQPLPERGGAGDQARPALLPLDGFWAVPFDLRPAFGLVEAPDRTTTEVVSAAPPVLTDPAPAAAPPPPVLVVGQEPERTSYGLLTSPAPAASPPVPAPQTAASNPRARRSRMYLLPAARNEAPGAAAAPEGEHVSSKRPADPEGEIVERPGSAMQEQPTRAPLAVNSDWRAYRPEQDEHAALLITEALLAKTLWWAHTKDQGEGVSFTWFHMGLGLRSKAHAPPLRTALRERGLIARDLRGNWFRLLTVEEAVAQGRLAPGPWCPSPMAETTAVPSADDGMLVEQTARPTAPAAGQIVEEILA